MRRLTGGVRIVVGANSGQGYPRAGRYMPSVSIFANHPMGPMFTKVWQHLHGAKKRLCCRVFGRIPTLKRRLQLLAVFAAAPLFIVIPYFAATQDSEIEPICSATDSLAAAADALAAIDAWQASGNDRAAVTDVGPLRRAQALLAANPETAARELAPAIVALAAAASAGGRLTPRDEVVLHARASLQLMLEMSRTAIGSHLKAAAALERRSFRRHNYVVAIAATGILVFIFAAWEMFKGVTHPIRFAVDMAESVAQGDLSKVITVDRTDEIGTLQESLREMSA